MSTIFENVKRKQKEFLANPVQAGQNMGMAIAALRDGVKSSAWEFYMTQFARDDKGVLDKDQLARLMGTDNTLGDPILDRQRAYLVGNAFCGMSTTVDFDRGILGIDHGLATNADVFKGPPCETTLVVQTKKKGGSNKGKGAAKKKKR